MSRIADRLARIDALLAGLDKRVVVTIRAFPVEGEPTPEPIVLVISGPPDAVSAKAGNVEVRRGKRKAA